MSKRIDYEATAAKLDYAALNKKLEQLAQEPPPKRRNTALAMLTPLRNQLLALQQKGWSHQEIAEALKADGVPVSAARLRDAFNLWTKSGKTSRPPGTTLKKTASPSAPLPPPATQIGRSKSAGNGSQSGLKFPEQ